MKFNDVYAVDMYANNVIKNFDKSLLFGDPDEIPLEDIIEFNYGVKIVYAHLSSDNSILGVTIFDDCAIPVFDSISNKYQSLFVTGGSIVVEQNLLTLCEKKFMFTLAHEFAHWLIHYDYFSATSDVANKSTKQKLENQIEADADLLALSLLLPRGRVKVAYDRLRYKLKRDVAIRVISDTFNVPVELVSKRLFDMKLARVY